MLKCKTLRITTLYLMGVLLSLSDSASAASALPAGTQGAVTNIFCSDLFSEFTKIEVHLDDQNAADFLAREVGKLLHSLQGDMPLPAEIVIIPADHRGPKYRDQFVSVWFPMFIPFFDGSEPNGYSQTHILSWSDSLGLSLHEVFHQLFEHYIKSRFEADHPEMVWAFFTEMDMRGEKQSFEFIEKTKGRSPYADQTTEQLQEHFFELTVRSTSFNEFVADMGPILFLNDPNAILRSLAGRTEDSAGRSADLDWRLASYHRLNSEYTISGPAKTFLWRNIYQSRRPTLGVAIRKMFDATLGAFLECTHNLQFYDRKVLDDPAVFNPVLIRHLRTQFGT